MEKRTERAASSPDTDVQTTTERKICVRLFGGFELYLNGVRQTELKSAKDRQLLALLLIARGEAVERNLIAQTLWPFPDFDTGRAAANLRRGLWVLRHALGAEAWRLRGPTQDVLQFDLTDAWIDLVEFDRAVSIGDRASLGRVVALHRGPLLQTCTEQWVESERERCLNLRDQARRALQTDALLPGQVSSTEDRDPATDPDDVVARAAFATRRDTGCTAVQPPARDSESEGGAVPLESSFYIIRTTDEAFEAAISRRDSIVLVKGAHQSGKTSLLARGVQKAREVGARVVLTDLQTLTTDQLASADDLFLTLAGILVDQLELDVDLEQAWNPKRGWNVNFERFLRREVLAKLDTPLVWAIDEVDRLFGRPFSAEVFGLFRSWHNQRALDPAGPWGRFTLAMAYATEAHLFITDLNQSPFNVGTRLTLEDFSLAQVEELNQRYRSPLRSPQETRRFQDLVGGHPDLVRRGLRAMVAKQMPLDVLDAEADHENGLFADHLRRMLHPIYRDQTLVEAVACLLRDAPLPPDDSFYRLRSAGVIVGSSADDARLRCDLYRRFLVRRLR